MIACTNGSRICRGSRKFDIWQCNWGAGPAFRPYKLWHFKFQKMHFPTFPCTFYSDFKRASPTYMFMYNSKLFQLGLLQIQNNLEVFQYIIPNIYDLRAKLFEEMMS